MRQIDVAIALGTTQSVILLIWRCYRETESTRERYLGRPRVTTPPMNRYVQLECHNLEGQLCRVI